MATLKCVPPQWPTDIFTPFEYITPQERSSPGEGLYFTLSGNQAAQAWPDPGGLRIFLEDFWAYSEEEGLLSSPLARVGDGVPGFVCIGLEPLDSVPLDVLVQVDAIARWKCRLNDGRMFRPLARFFRRAVPCRTCLPGECVVPGPELQDLVGAHDEQYGPALLAPCLRCSARRQRCCTNARDTPTARAVVLCPLLGGTWQLDYEVGPAEQLSNFHLPVLERLTFPHWTETFQSAWRDVNARLRPADWRALGFKSAEFPREIHENLDATTLFAKSYMCATAPLARTSLGPHTFYPPAAISDLVVARRAYIPEVFRYFLDRIAAAFTQRANVHYICCRYHPPSRLSRPIVGVIEATYTIYVALGHQIWFYRPQLAPEDHDEWVAHLHKVPELARLFRITPLQACHVFEMAVAKDDYAPAVLHTLERLFKAWPNIHLVHTLNHAATVFPRPPNHRDMPRVRHTHAAAILTAQMFTLDFALSMLYDLDNISAIVRFAYSHPSCHSGQHYSPKDHPEIFALITSPDEPVFTAPHESLTATSSEDAATPARREDSSISTLALESNHENDADDEDDNADNEDDDAGNKDDDAVSEGSVYSQVSESFAELSI